MNGRKDNIYVNVKNDSQQQPKVRIDIIEYMFLLFCKIRKILTRGVELVIVAIGTDAKIKIFLKKN